MVNTDEYTIAHCAQLHVLKCDLPFECERRWMWSGCELEAVTEFPLFYITDRQNTAISTWLSSQTSYLQVTTYGHVDISRHYANVACFCVGCPNWLLSSHVTSVMGWRRGLCQHQRTIGLPAPPRQMFI